MIQLQGMQKIRRADLKKWFRRDNLIVLVLAGILLFVIALPTKEKTEETADLSKKAKEVQRAEDAADPDWELYARRQERRLEEMLQDMAGVGEVRVMLTISDSEELVVEKDMPVKRSETSETDSGGGSRSIAQFDRGATTVYRTGGGNSEPYVVKTRIPRVEGVLVVARGAGTGSINRDITEIAKALFGVEAHKVKVVRMESGR